MGPSSKERGHGEMEKHPPLSVLTLPPGVTMRMLGMLVESVT
jgi:hypothetical protein